MFLARVNAYACVNGGARDEILRSHKYTSESDTLLYNLGNNSGRRRRSDLPPGHKSMRAVVILSLSPHHWHTQCKMRTFAFRWRETHICCSHVSPLLYVWIQKLSARRAE